MNIAQWRTGLRTWFTNFLVVDSWDLRNPTEYAKTNAFISPLQNLTFINGETDFCVANQDIYITTRYRGDTKYDQLPLGSLEQLYSAVAQRLVLTFTDIAPLRALELVAVPECISVVEYGDDMADWLVTLMFSVNISWVPDKTPLPGDPASPVENINAVNISLFREKINSDNHLDPATRDKYGQITITRP